MIKKKSPSKAQRSFSIILFILTLSLRSGFVAGADDGVLAEVEKRPRLVVIANVVGTVEWAAQVGSIVRGHRDDAQPIAQIASPATEARITFLRREVGQRREYLEDNGFAKPAETVPPKARKKPVEGNIELRNAVATEISKLIQPHFDAALLRSFVGTDFLFRGIDPANAVQYATYSKIVASLRATVPIAQARDVAVRGALQKAALQALRLRLLDGVPQRVSIDPRDRLTVIPNDTLLWDTELKRVRVKHAENALVSTDLCGGFARYWRVVEENQIFTDDDDMFIAYTLGLKNPRPSVYEKIEADCKQFDQTRIAREKLLKELQGYENVVLAQGTAATKRQLDAIESKELRARVEETLVAIQQKWPDSDEISRWELAHRRLRDEVNKRGFSGSFLRMDAYVPRAMGMRIKLGEPPFFVRVRNEDPFKLIRTRKDIELEKTLLPEFDVRDALRNLDQENLLRIEEEMEEQLLAERLEAEVVDLNQSLERESIRFDDGRVWPTTPVEVVESRAFRGKSVSLGDALAIVEPISVPILTLPRLQWAQQGLPVRITISEVVDGLLPTTLKQKQQILASGERDRLITVLKSIGTRALVGRTFAGQIITDTTSEVTRIRLEEIQDTELDISPIGSDAVNIEALLVRHGFVSTHKERAILISASAGVFDPGCKLRVQAVPEDLGILKREEALGKWAATTKAKK